jgi:hypothetical protein
MRWMDGWMGGGGGGGQLASERRHHGGATGVEERLREQKFAVKSKNSS